MAGTAKTGKESGTSHGVDVRPWTHQRTFLWLAEHPGYLAGYEGEWVAMVGPTIVGHSPEIGEAVGRAREAGFDDPLLVPVLPPDEYVF
jgi:hypothetical protein